MMARMLYRFVVLIHVGCLEGAAAGQEWASANVVRIGQVIQARLKAEVFTK
jgi:hypothetical protein